MSCNAAAQEAKKGGEAALLAGGHAQLAAGEFVGEFLCLVLQRVRSLAAEKPDALRGRCETRGRCGSLAGAQLRPALPSALDLGHRGRVTWALWPDQQRAAA